MNTNSDGVEEGEESAAKGGGVAGIDVRSLARYKAISAFSRSKN